MTTVSLIWKERAQKAEGKLQKAPELPKEFKSTDEIADWIAEYSVWYKTRLQ